MVDQKLQSSVPTQTGKIPDKWQEKYLIKRIDEDDIEISVQERNGILQALNSGQRFIQIKKYTLMLNGIKSIDPKWGEKNIPSKPEKPYPKIKTIYEKLQNGNHKQIDMVINKDEINRWEKEILEWEEYFGYT